MKQVSNILRRLEPNEFNQSIDLLQYSFQFKVSDETYRRLDGNFPGEIVWGVFENGSLRSQLCALQFEIGLNGRAVRAAGITRVSSYPEARRSGNVSRLADHALRELRQQGVAIALLIPFDIGFYRRFGWEVVSDYTRLRLRRTQFPRWWEAGGVVVREEPLAEAAVDIYRTYIAHYNGAILRTPYWWNEVTRPRKAGSAAVHYDGEGVPAGYVLYTFRDQPADLTYQQLRGGRELVVHELAYRNEVSKRRLWNFLVSHETMVDSISLTLPPGDSLAFELPDPNVEQSRVPYAMGRIVDVGRFIADYRFLRLEHPVEFVVEIEDGRAEWNAGTWTLRIDRDGSAVADKVPSRREPSAKIDIGALTALLFGYQRPRILAETGRLAATDAVIADLEAAIPHALPYVPDFF